MQILFPLVFEVIGWVLGEQASNAARHAPLPTRIALATVVVLTAFAFTIGVIIVGVTALGILQGLVKSA